MSAWYRWQFFGLLVAVAMAGAVAGQDPEPRRVLLLSQGPDGHPPATHEYAAGMRVLAHCLQGVPGVQARGARADEPWPEGPGLIQDSDAVVLFLSEGAKWIHQDPRRLEAFGRLAARRGGLAVLHWGMGTREARYIGGFLALLGGCHGGPDRKYKVLETRVDVADHEITRGIDHFSIHDEFYYQLKFVDAGRSLEPLLFAEIAGAREPVAWAWQRADGGRSFGFSGGHFHKNWSRVEYRRLVTQGVLWTLNLPVPPPGLPVEITADELKLD